MPNTAILRAGQIVPKRVARGPPTVTSVFKPHPPQHRSSHVNYISLSIHRKNRPGRNKRRVPTAEVRLLLLSYVLASEQSWFMCNRPRTASIHTLDDDSILHVFYLSRPFFGDGDDVADWNYNGRWWYALAHVDRRWRNIILGSASYLGLSLLCTYGTPVADILAHSPPLPLVLSYFTKDRKPTTEDEEGIILALKHRDRVRRVRFNSAVEQRLFVAMHEEYPILEYLYITRRIEDDSTILRFPETLQAPHLRYLSLRGFTFSIGSRLLTTAVGLVTLQLVMVHPSTYFHPNTLIQWISLMPHLETLKVYFKSSIPSRDVERQLTHAPSIAPITLPNLHYINFRGVSSYLEALVHRITTPRLEDLQIGFYNQLLFSVPRLLQFIDAAENLRFGNTVLIFSDKTFDAGFFPHGGIKECPLGISVLCWHLDWQVSSATQISNSLSQMLSAVEYLVLQHEVHSQSSEEHNEVDRTEWRNLLRPYTNVKTLRIEKELVKDLSRCLELEDGELPLELLPELQELIYFGNSDTVDPFTSFVDARRDAGRPVTLFHR